MTKLDHIMVDDIPKKAVKPYCPLRFNSPPLVEGTACGAASRHSGESRNPEI
jgi:hypothetical protein